MSANVTFSTCFYMIHSKFPPSQYLEWMHNFVSMVQDGDFNLVIYTDASTASHFDGADTPRIKVVLKPMEEFHNYKYKDHWVRNHAENYALNDKSSWELNMLWAEKIHFVKETIERKYFHTVYHGWCDIGYFRNRPEMDTPTSQLAGWPNRQKINALDPKKIVYACINNNDVYMSDLIRRIKHKRPDGLPMHPIPALQTSIAGGFFLLHRQKIQWWFETFDRTLERYFEHAYLVKDDQIILADCVFSHLEHFSLCRERSAPYDNWFMFQRIFD